ncbi:CoA-binding protein [Flagellimonas sp.]|uniref:CoA-binding protein n=1 Tax=Flagellimonas sp. TaxID=2058762 RepID=UPI003B50167B
MSNTLVFGASLNPSRYSNLAIHRLVENQKETVAFGVREGTVSGIQITDNLDDLQNIHTITLYLNPKRQKEYYDKIIGLRPKRVIFNPGTENPEFAQLLLDEGIKVENACTLVLLATGQY